MRAPVFIRRVFAAVALAFSTAEVAAQIPDLHLSGNLPGQLTEFGVGFRDTLRKRLGTCYKPVGAILVCGKRNSYRIERNVFDADRSSGSYEDYVEARVRNAGRDN